MIGGQAAIDRLSSKGLLGQRLPCCTFVACWLLEAAGRAPRTGGLGAYKAASKGISADWWDLANVIDEPGPAEPDAWGLERAVALLGLQVDGWPRRATVGRGMWPPPVQLGRWHVVQRWRESSLDAQDSLKWDGDRPAAKLSGHAYLLFGDAPPGRVRVVQSSEGDGFQDGYGGWYGTAGLEGHRVSHSVLTVAP